MLRVHTVAVLFVAALIALTTGCGRNKQKNEVYQHWNSARAAVQGSLANERYKLGNLDDARKAVDEAIKLDPKNPGYRILSARIYMERNMLEAADQELATARTLAPRLGEIDYLSGVIYQRWQKPELALEYYTKASEKQPGELQFLMARAEVMVQLQRTEEAIKLLQSKLTYFEYSGPLRDLLGSLYQQQGNMEEASRMYYQATILSPEDLTIRERLARSYFELHRYAQCGEQVDTILKDPKYQARADLYLLKGECLLQVQDFRGARDALEKSLELNGSSVPALLAMTKASISLDDLPRAEVSLRKAMSLQPDESQVHLAMGYLRMEQKKWPEALKSFTRAAELAPKDAMPVCMMGLVYERQGNTEEAMKYYGKALQIQPGDKLATELLSKLK